MREIALFVEDYAHQQVIGTLVQRIGPNMASPRGSTGATR